jgi:hypothetical protein
MMVVFRLLILWSVLIFESGTADAWEEFTVERAKILFEDGEEARGRAVGESVTREYRRIVQLLKLDPQQGLPMLTVYACGSEATFSRITGGRIPDWGGACAFPERGIIVLKPQHAVSLPMHRVIAHELSHVLLGSLAGETQVPRWFDEGVAMWVSGEWAFRQRVSMMWSFLLGEGAIPFAEVNDVLSFGSTKAAQAYDESMAALLFLVKEEGQETPGEIVRAMADTVRFDRAFEEATGITPEIFEKRWRDHARKTFHPLMLFVEDVHLWVAFSLILPILYLIKRLRGRRVLKEWEAEEGIEP